MYCQRNKWYYWLEIRENIIYCKCKSVDVFMMFSLFTVNGIVIIIIIIISVEFKIEWNGGYMDLMLPLAIILIWMDQSIDKLIYSFYYLGKKSFLFFFFFWCMRCGSFDIYMFFFFLDLIKFACIHFVSFLFFAFFFSYLVYWWWLLILFQFYLAFMSQS